jgi:hypothetical protein
MGYSLSWFAVRGKSPELVLSQLELHATGTREEIPESPIVAAELPDGWYLVLSNQDTRFVEDASLRRISAGCEVVSCFVEEHVMCSEARGWKDGKELWSVCHDAQVGIDNLEKMGALPSTFSSIHTRLLAEREKAGAQAADFLFDVPVELAKAETGFRHDEDCPGGKEDPFELLATGRGQSDSSSSSPTRKKSWIKSLFGGKP